MNSLKKLAKLPCLGKRNLLFLILLPLSYWVKGQFSMNPDEFKLSTLAVAGSKVLPFWFRSNQYGMAPGAGNFLQIRGSMHHEYDTLLTQNRQPKPWAIGYGLEITGNLAGKNSALLLPEAYLKIRFKHWEFYGGRRKEIFGLVDTTLTSGSYIWSGNALPMPKVQLHTPGYVPLGKKGKISYQAGISHGWFGSDSVIQNYWLHQKWLYGKLGNGNVQVMAGVNHQVQWGGYSEILKDVGGLYPPTIDGFLAPYPLYSYQYIILPFLQKLAPPSTMKVPGYDGGLAVGNQLGSVDLALQIKLDNATLLIYKQQPYDFARSISRLNNIEDGLHGISIYPADLPQLQQITLEFFNSKSQGRYRFGRYNDSNFGEVDNYFSHGQYQSWSYRDNLLGNAFIGRDEQTERITNNRLHFFYLSARGQWGKFSYLTRQAFSRNFGTYAVPFAKNQYSGWVQLAYVLKENHLLQAALAMDQGNLYPASQSIQLSSIFTW